MEPVKKDGSKAVASGDKFFVVDAPDTYPGRREEPQVTGAAIAMAYVNYALIILLGHLRDFFAKIFQRSRYIQSVPPAGYAPLFKSWENFYTRRLYHRIQDCWNRPIDSSPGAHISVIVRDSDDGNKTLSVTEQRKDLLNLGSYNYLGFADDWQTTCKPHVLPVLEDLPVACGTNRADFGTTRVHKQLEELVARFLGKEDAVVFNMGYATNSSGIPMLAGKGTLVVSDSLNHMSIVSGCRTSGAHIRVFKHNSCADLEAVLREAIVLGMPRSRRPWKKIIVMIEGIYSMEGEIVDLKGLVEVAKRYRAYVYLDEAHSIGALGKTGRGACEYCGVDPADVDVLMGTFTKSFGGMGGYIAGSAALCAHLRDQCPAFVCHSALSPVVAQQVYVALRIIMGEDGTGVGAAKLRRLRDNANYVRARLEAMGLHVYGDYNSPVIPVMLYMPGKIAAFSRCAPRAHAQ
eukprot:TRINITY_DN3852_c0_g1_i3.p1 TRINITY_DN3852_c0_g1~~TRINITY_DN3852_c0_g1_i3.p1  ORF type:complete len:510 (-),score=176.13 TRINITY_DN3852_c0_g1_i3:1864-3246(-)